MSQSLNLVLDLSGVGDLATDEPIKVALVREGRVLASAVVDPKKIADRARVPVSLFSAAAPGDLAGAAIHVGPDAPDKAIAHPNASISTIAPAAIAATRAGAPIEIGPVVITDAIYKRWRVLCRTFTVKGRLVQRVMTSSGPCLAPVPAATVEIYDVDRIGCFVRRDLITTATTRADGTFEARFRWCCSPWIFRPHDPFIVDLALWEKLRDLLRRLKKLVTLPFPIPTDPDPPDPFVLMRVLDDVESLVGAQVNAGALPRTILDPRPVRGAAPEMAEAAPPAPIAIAQPALRPELARVRLSRDALAAITELRRLFPPWWWWRADCAPDLLLRATQVVGTLRVVYDESWTSTRWNVAPPTVDVGDLFASEAAVANTSVCGTPTPAGSCMKFVRVGRYEITEIGTTAAAGPLAGFVVSGNQDLAFGQQIDLFAVFGAGTRSPAAPDQHVDYYKLQIAPWNGNPAAMPSDADYSDVPLPYLKGISQHYLSVVGAPPATTAWVAVGFGPATVLGQNGLYRSVDSVQREYEAAHGGPPDGGAGWGWIWTNRDLLATVDTTYLPNGQYLVRVIAYRMVGGALVPRRMTACGAPGTAPVVELLPLAVDNRALTAYTPENPTADVAIEGLMKNGVEVPFFACQKIDVHQGDELIIRFRAIDPAHHLGGFSLHELHRIGCTVQLGSSGPTGTLWAAGGTGRALDSYAEVIAVPGAVRPSWSGGSYWVKVTVGPPPPTTATCNSCGEDRPFFPFSGAYNLRLGVTKRVTNGYYNPFYTESNALVVINRTDAP
ncbi:MAG: hypothetical protein U0359_14435 [Byssovorax sp.]